MLQNLSSNIFSLGCIFKSNWGFEHILGVQSELEFGV